MALNSKNVGTDPRWELGRWSGTRWVLTGLAFLLCLATSNLAAAQGFDDLEKDKQREFDKLLDRCITAYDRERYDDAEDLCDQAAAITPHPATRYVVARIRDRSGECEAAVKLYTEVRESTPPGSSEARWLEEYSDSLDEYIGLLGNCAAKIDVACKDDGALVLADGELIGTCPDVLETTPGEHEIALVAPGKEPATRILNTPTGRPTPVEFDALADAAEPSGPATVALSCPDFANGAAITWNGSVLGMCPLVVELDSGSQKLFGYAADGRRGVAVVEVDSDQQVEATLRPYRELEVVCADPDVRIQSSHELLEKPLGGRCGDLAETGVQLPDAGYTFTVSRDNYQSDELQVDVDESTSAIEVEQLQRLPVEFSVTCKQTDEPPVMVRIGSIQGQCPLQGTLPEGPYLLEARRDGHDPWEQEVELALAKDNQLTVPALESRSFFTPGTITAMSGGALILTAVIIDVAGLADLNEFKDLSDGKFDPDEEEEARQRYDELKPVVNRNIWLTRVFYGVGIAALGTGIGLIIYEVVTADPDSFESDTTAIRLVPSVVGDVSGRLAPGAGVHIRF